MIRYCVAYEKEWLAAIGECGFKNVKPYGAVEYLMAFQTNGGSGAMREMFFERNRVYGLPPCEFGNEGKRFVGWLGSNGRRYDDAMIFFNLAPAGGKVTMTAIWE